MKKKIFIAIGIVAAIFIGLAGIKFLQIHKMIAFGETRSGVGIREPVRGRFRIIGLDGGGL